MRTRVKAYLPDKVESMMRRGDTISTPDGSIVFKNRVLTQVLPNGLAIQFHWPQDTTIIMDILNTRITQVGYHSKSKRPRKKW